MEFTTSSSHKVVTLSIHFEKYSDLNLRLSTKDFKKLKKVVNSVKIE